MTLQNSLKEGEWDLQKHAHLGTQTQAKAVTNTNSNADQTLHLTQDNYYIWSLLGDLA